MTLNIQIRQETLRDHPAVFRLLEAAFRDEAYSDQQEPFLVERLRKSEVFVPELSLVAELNNTITGYILLTKIGIKNGNQYYDSLALAPVAVLPDYQGQGIGGQLIKTAHEKAKDLGFSSVILVGHAEYYPRFGYRPANEYNITLPFEVPKENAMALELIKGSLAATRGMVQYPAVFFEDEENE